MPTEHLLTRQLSPSLLSPAPSSISVKHASRPDPVPGLSYGLKRACSQRLRATGVISTPASDGLALPSSHPVLHGHPFLLLAQQFIPLSSDLAQD